MNNKAVVTAGKPDRVQQTSRRTHALVETALLVAVTLVMGLTPLGTIRTPLLSISLVTIPVAIAAMLIGVQGSIACGTIFGITSFINALTGASGLLSTLFTISPFGVFVTAVIARILMGIFTGLIYRGLHGIHGLRTASYYITALAAPLLNTFFFMGSLVLFFYHTDYIQNLAAGLGAVNPISFIVLLVGVQGMIEAVVCTGLAGTVGLLVAKALHRH